VPSTITDTERFLARVDQRGPAQCWWWSGAIDGSNFPRMRSGDGSQRAVARFAWEVVYLRGPIPEGFVIVRVEHDWDPCVDPTNCSHRLCMNPAHMTLARKSTIDSERMRRVVNVPKTRCRKGHYLTDDNIIWIDRSRNRRMCRICRLNKLASYALAQK
jgi:hypothetical protein